MNLPFMLFILVIELFIEYFTFYISGMLYLPVFVGGVSKRIWINQETVIFVVLKVTLKPCSLVSSIHRCLSMQRKKLRLGSLG